MVVLEAMMTGLPIVGTRVGGVPGVVPSDAGLLVEAACPGELAGAMRPLRSDPNRRAEMGNNARKHALARHTVERMVSLYIDAYQKALRA